MLKENVFESNDNSTMKEKLAFLAGVMTANKILYERISARHTIDLIFNRLETKLEVVGINEADLDEAIQKLFSLEGARK